MSDTRVQMNLSVPEWFKNGLQQIAQLQSQERGTERTMSEIAVECTTEKYPQILELKTRGGFVSKLISSSKAKTTPP